MFYECEPQYRSINLIKETLEALSHWPVVIATTLWLEHHAKTTEKGCLTRPKWLQPETKLKSISKQTPVGTGYRAVALTYSTTVCRVYKHYVCPLAISMTHS